MAKNNKHWKNFMASPSDRKIAKEGRDPLEEGLEGLTWIENSKRIVRNRWNKTRETFGEEVGNSITSGVLMMYILFMTPFASLHAYKCAPEGMGDIDSFSVSAFMVTSLLALLFTTVYHCTKHGTPQKRIFGKLDHIMVYYAILGVFAPICLSLIGGGLGLGILIAELCLAVTGTFFMIFAYPEKKTMSKVALSIYGIMGVLGLFILKPLYHSATKVSFWLIIAGAATYLVGTFFYSGKKFKFSHMVWHILVAFATVCYVLTFVYCLR